MALKQLQIRVMQTGQDWPEFRRMRARVHGKKWFAHFFGDDVSVAALRWRWDHVYRFDAAPALKLNMSGTRSLRRTRHVDSNRRDRREYAARSNGCREPGCHAESLFRGQSLAGRGADGSR